jgi:DNA-binding GntR family transcriptional regulator
VPSRIPRPRRPPVGTTPAALIAERLRRAIVRGAFRAGEALHETELARRYRASRTVLRDALRRLEADGFVEVRPYRGAVVADLSPAGLIDLAEMRGLVEPLALRLAIPRLRSADLARAEAALDAARRERDPARAAEQAWRFYAALYARAGRPVLVDAIRRLHALARGHADLGPAAARALAARTQRRQRAILASLRAGRGDHAVESLRRLISSSTGDLGSMLAGARAPTLRPVREPPR